MLRLNESFEYVNVEMTAPGCSVHALEHLDTEKIEFKIFVEFKI